MGRASAPHVRMIFNRFKDLIDWILTECVSPSTIVAFLFGCMSVFVVLKVIESLCGVLRPIVDSFSRSKRWSRSSVKGKWQLTVDEILAVGTELERGGYEHQVILLCACILRACVRAPFV